MPRYTGEEPMDPPVTPSPDRPTPLSVHPDGIPEELKARDSWVVWNYESRGGQWTKPPYRADQPHRKADSTNSDTWCSYGTALASYEDGKADGIGFIPVEGLVGIDLDHCRNSQTGEIDPYQMRIVNQANSRTEITVSGEGLRIFLRARMTTTRRRAEGLEIYPGGGGRYFTTTGLHLTGTPTTIESRQGELEFICSEYLPERTASSTSTTAAQYLAPSDNPSVNLNDAELIIRARGAKNGDAFSRLWDGDIAGHESHSEADLALASHLAYWTDRESTRMDRLFRMSGLMRDKWDERHGEQTYGERTITKAISTSVGRRQPSTGQPSTGVDDQDELAAIEAKANARQTLNELLNDIRTFIKRYLVLRDYEIDILTVWAVHTFCIEAFDYTPYLAITSATPSAGKTRVLEVLDLLIDDGTHQKSWLTASTTKAVLVRKIDSLHPVLLLDETDGAFTGNQEYAAALRSILNSGYSRRSGIASLCVGAQHDWKDFETFCCKAFAGIGHAHLPDTILTRSIPIEMKRKKRNEAVEKMRHREALQLATPIRKRIAAWAAPQISALKTARPQLPPGLDGRAEDICEPLVIIADMGGQRVVWKDTAGADRTLEQDRPRDREPF